MKLLDVEKCSFGYRQQSRFLPILKDISFSVKKGDFLLLLGANGCGKSTIMKGVMGLGAYEGYLQLHIASHKIGYVPQESELTTDTPATALDIVSLALPQMWGASRKKALTLLKRVGLSEKVSMRFGHLSGGQKRRVLLARALMNDPELLIMDEPTAFTDKETVATIETIVTELCDSKEVGIIASTHSSGWAKNAKVLELEGVAHE